MTGERRFWEMGRTRLEPAPEGTYHTLVQVTLDSAVINREQVGLRLVTDDPSHAYRMPDSLLSAEQEDGLAGLVGVFRPTAPELYPATAVQVRVGDEWLTFALAH